MNSCRPSSISLHERLQMGEVSFHRYKCPEFVRTNSVVSELTCLHLVMLIVSIEHDTMSGRKTSGIQKPKSE